MLAPPLDPDQQARPAILLPDPADAAAVGRAAARLDRLDLERTWPVILAATIAPELADLLGARGAEIHRLREGRGIGKTLRRRVELLRRARVERLVADDAAALDPGWRLALAIARLGRARDPNARPAARPGVRARRPPAILFVLKSRPDDRRAHVLQALATVRGLVEEGARVRLLCPLEDRAEEVLRERLGAAADGVETVPLPRVRRRLETFARIGRLVAEAAHAGIELCYVRQPRLAPFVLHAARPLGLPVALEAHQPYATWALRERARLLRGADGRILGRLARADRRLEAAIYRAVAGVVVTTEALARRVERLAPGTNVLVAPNPPTSDPAEDPPPLARRPIDVLYAGRLDPLKGTDVLVRALALAPGVRARFVGPGERERRSLAALVEGLGLADRVEVAGWAEPKEVVRLFRSSRLLVHPLPARGSREWRLFTCPLKILEGMAQGCAVVSSDLPAVRELVRPGREGLLVPPGDERALAAAIRSLLEDPALAQSLADAGRRRAAPLAPRRRARRLLAFFESVGAATP